MRYSLPLLLLGCSYSGYEPEYEDLKSRASKNPAWTPSPEGSSSAIEERLLRLLDAEPSPDFSRAVALEELARFALARNPGLRAMLKRLEAAVEQVPQDASLPDPELRLAFSAEDFFRRFAEFMIEIMQPLLFPGKLEARARMSIEMAWEEWEKVREMMLRLRAEVAMEYAELHSLDQSLRILRENAKLIEQLEAVVRARFETREVPQQDVLKVRLRALEVQNEIIRTSRERREAEARLNALLGRRDMAPIGAVAVPEDPKDPEALDSLWKRALEGRPEVAAMTHRLRGALAKLRMAELEWWPDPVPGFEYTLMKGGDHEVKPSLGIPLTFLRPGRRKAAEAQARAVLGESWHLYEKARVEIAREVAAAHARVRATRESIELFRDKLRPQARQTFEAAMSGYRTGEVDFLTAIDALLEQQKIEEQYFRLLGDHLAAREELLRATGGP